MIDDDDGGRKAERLINALLVLVVIACVAVVACHQHPGPVAEIDPDIALKLTAALAVGNIGGVVAVALAEVRQR